MKSFSLFAAVLSIVSAQICQFSDVGTASPISGTFSSSGVWNVFRTVCDGKPSNTVPVRFTSFADNVNSDDFETKTVANPLNMGNRLFLYLLIDASSSQLAYLQSTTSSLVTGIKNGLANNQSAYQNVTMTAAYFDGTASVTVLQDWTDNVQSVFDAITNKFSNGKYTPSDNSTNLNGAFDQALRSIDKKMNATWPGFKSWPTGAIYITGDTIDTASSWYKPGTAKFYQPFWNIPRFVLSSGYRYGNQFISAIGAGSIPWNNTIPTPDSFITSNIGSYASTFATTAQGFWLGKVCTAIRSVTYDVAPGGTANVHGIKFQMTQPITVQTDTALFDASSFGKGCDIDTYVNSAGGLGASLFVVLIIASLF